jgi:hypothetical protein
MGFEKMIWVNFNQDKVQWRNQDSSVNITTVYGPDDQCSIPGRNNIFLYSTASIPTLGPKQSPVSYAMSTWGFLI